MNEVGLLLKIIQCLKNLSWQPGEYASHLIGHEGKGSLLSSLKDLGYVDDLSAGCEEEANGFDFFDINCDLTEDGVGKFLKFRCVYYSLYYTSITKKN